MDERLTVEKTRRANPENPIILKILILTMRLPFQAPRGGALTAILGCWRLGFLRRDS